MVAGQHKLSRRAVLAGACAGAVVPLPLVGAAAKVGTVTSDCSWERALASYARAVAGLERVAHVEDDDLYDLALGRHNRALARLLGAAAPDLGAVAEKLELILRHSVFELSFGEAALAALRRDVREFAGVT